MKSALLEISMKKEVSELEERQRTLRGMPRDPDFKCDGRAREWRVEREADFCISAGDVCSGNSRAGTRKSGGESR